MKKKNRIRIFSLMAIGLLLLFIQNCENEDNINPANGKTTALFNLNKTYGSLTDQDGNVYKTITIGSQTWMAENLRTTKYRNGEVIPEVTDGIKWSNLSTGAYCNYQNTKNIDTIATFGRLYNWFAVIDDRKIAPSGWHVPTYDEWIILETYLGDSVAGNKLKETGTIHWQFPNYYADNETGFTALPGGYRWIIYTVGSGFFHIGIEGGWWTVTERDNNLDNAFHVTMGYNYSILGGCNCPKHEGYSIRCVKD
jgi:uncharacterized protein (TIGR02145 family)